MSKTRASKPNGKKEESRSRASDSSSSSTPSMKTSEIRDLIDFISKSGLNEVNIETSELKLSVKRDPDQKVFKSSPATPIQAVIPALNPIAAISNAEAQSTKPELPPPGTTPGKKTVEIRSPMIGTFYRSANPDSPVFVSVGDKITKGQTVCIIEAMKLFNEIESEVSGTIVKIMIENSTPVEYDQVLFIVEPD
jgi:acetyl-CoA carboxylase biotin carboxyl carrier protein